MSSPLAGNDFVRLLYLDESGTNPSHPNVVVAGVLIDGDKDWPEVDQRIVKLIEKYVEPARRLGFVFHATDIYHGSGYFDRRKPQWENHDSRNAVLVDLARILSDLSIPVIVGVYGREITTPNLADWAPDRHTDAMLTCATVDCLIRADRWLEDYAPDKLATVVHEDGTKAKRLIKGAVRLCRSADYMNLFEGSEGVMKDLALPLKRIIDTVHFADKPDARPLQLADLCAFLLTRLFRNAHVPTEAAEILKTRAIWFIEWAERTSAVKRVGQSS
jgi:hypothetical protein